MQIDKLTHTIIGIAIKIHRTLGPGLFESVYQAAVAYELHQADIPFEKEKILAVRYEDVILDVGFRCDFLIDNQGIVACKAVRQLADIDQAQLINYLKIADKSVGLLINFNVKLLKNGLKRFVN